MLKRRDFFQINRVVSASLSCSLRIQQFLLRQISAETSYVFGLVYVDFLIFITCLDLSQRSKLFGIVRYGLFCSIRIILGCVTVIHAITEKRVSTIIFYALVKSTRNIFFIFQNFRSQLICCFSKNIVRCCFNQNRLVRIRIFFIP